MRLFRAGRWRAGGLWLMSELPGDELVVCRCCQAVQHNLRAQGSAAHQHVHKLFSPPTCILSDYFKKSPQQQFTYSNKSDLIIMSPSRSDCFSTPVEMLISERQPNLRLTGRKWFLIGCQIVFDKSKCLNILQRPRSYPFHTILTAQ